MNKPEQLLTRGLFKGDILHEHPRISEVKSLVCTIDIFLIFQTGYRVY